jgi:hypothetical protein
MEYPTLADSLGAFRRRPAGAWFDDFEDASEDTVEPEPFAAVHDGRDDVADYRELEAEL